jgi:hypothetical protein
MASGDVFPKLLDAPTFLGTSTTTLFTVPTGRQHAIKQIVVCNTDGTERWIKLAVGSTATAENCFVFQLPIASFDTVVLDTALVLEAAQTLQGSSDVASKVTVTVTGWEREL